MKMNPWEQKMRLYKMKHWFWSKQAITEKEYYELREKRYKELGILI